MAIPARIKARPPSAPRSSSDAARSVGEPREGQTERSLGEIREKTAGVREQLSRQELSQEQVEQIKKDSAAWGTKIAAAETQKHNYQSQVEIVLRAIDETATQIETQLNQYHELLLALQLFPATAPLANGTDFRIRLEHVEDCGSASSRDAVQ